MKKCEPCSSPRDGDGAVGESEREREERRDVESNRKEEEDLLVVVWTLCPLSLFSLRLK